MKAAACLLLLAVAAPGRPQPPVPCVRVIIGPPGTQWTVRNDTLLVVMAPPLTVGWYCPPGATPADTIPPMPPYKPARAS